MSTQQQAEQVYATENNTTREMSAMNDMTAGELIQAIEATRNRQVSKIETQWTQLQQAVNDYFLLGGILPKNLEFIGQIIKKPVGQALAPNPGITVPQRGRVRQPGSQNLSSGQQTSESRNYAEPTRTKRGRTARGRRASAADKICPICANGPNPSLATGHDKRSHRQYPKPFTSVEEIRQRGLPVPQQAQTFSAGSAR